MHRIDVRKIILVTLIGLFLSIFPSMSSAQNLEIHYINVQQGGCTLIVGPNGTTLLYDGGVEGKGTSEIIPYLQGLGIMSGQSLDYVIASHRDTDHYAGLTDVLNGGYDALHVFDNGSDKYNEYYQAFMDAAAGTTAGGVTAVTLGQVIDLGNGARATVVAANGSVLGVGAIPNGTVNENDRTICLLIEYGDFDFMLSGDVGGGSDDSACTGRSTSQINMETPLVTALMPGGAHPMLSSYGVEVVHVPHHGSESSTNSDYMNLLSPSVACISVGAGQSPDWFHPRKDVVENVLLAGVPCITVPPALVLQTEEGSPTGINTSYAGYCVGDIVITTNGVNSYTVSASGAVSQGPDERAYSGLPATFYFDEFSGGDMPPQLYSIHTDSITETSATVLWTTNEDTNSVVSYGTTAGSYTTTVSDSTLMINHSLSLTGLTPATKYYYIVKGTDSGGNTTTSPEYNFTTGGTAPAKVVFSEIYYDTIGTDSIEEWIELYNNSTTIVDISGWTITDNNGLGATYTIPAGTTIKPGTYLTIANDSIGFNALYGFDADVYGAFPGLNNTGDALIMKDSAGVMIDAVGWETGASGGLPEGWGSTSAPNASTGYSIVRIDVKVDTDTYIDWGTAANNGNPQTQTAPAGSKILFSEIFYDTPGDETKEEWIEFYNTTAADVDLGGWAIIDNLGTGFTYTFPAGTIIKAQTFLTIGRDSAGFTALYGYAADLYGNLPLLNNGGDALILYDASGNEIDAVGWAGGASAGVPADWGSITDPWASSGKTIVRKDPAVDTDTYVDWTYAENNGNPQTQTGGVAVAKVVFSEVFYDPLGDETKEEWLEIYNNSPNVVDLSGWKIIDNNGTAFVYTFPAGASIKPNTFLSIGRDSAAFVALYGYDADIYGNLPALNNSGEALVLYDASNNEVDAVAFEGGASAGLPEGWGSTTNPWASAGNTVVRIDPTVDTDTYVDWTYATNGGNPGTQTIRGNILFSEIFYDTLGDETKEEWIEMYNNSTFAVNIGGWKIIDNNGTAFVYTIPAGTIMEPGTFLTIGRDSATFVAMYGYEADLYGNLPALNNSGESLVLYDSNADVKDFVAWEGGASAGIPDGWGSTTSPWASAGNTIVRVDYTVDTDTYIDWTFATDNGHPQTQAMGVPDTTPPVISNVVVDAITINGAVVTWTTDENADARLEYGTESGNYVSTLNDSELITDHSITLTALNHNTTYYFHVISTDESGNEATSPEYSFKTLDILTNTLTLVDYKHTNDVYGIGTFTVIDSSGAPVAGATLNVTWSGGYYAGNDQGTTDENGQITFTSGSVHPKNWVFTITVDSIVKEGFYWDAANSVLTATVSKHPKKQ